MVKKAYSDEEHRILARMLKAGKDRQEIADAIGRSLDSVQKQARKLGYKNNQQNWTPERKAKLKELWEGGASYETIQKALGVGHEGAKKAARRFGLGAKFRAKAKDAWSEEEEEKLISLLDAGLPLKDIATQLKRSVKAVELRKRQVWTNPIEPEPVPMPIVPDDTPLEFKQVYQQVLSQASTIEMVLFTLWKTLPNQRVISIEDAAVKLVRLAGRGPAFFHARREWSMTKWAVYLATLTEEDFE